MVKSRSQLQTKRTKIIYLKSWPDLVPKKIRKIIRKILGKNLDLSREKNCEVKSKLVMYVVGYPKGENQKPGVKSREFLEPEPEN